MSFLTNFDLITLVKTVGYIGLFIITFAESGLFFGFFLPGDSLLFTAGFLASQSFLNIFILIVVCFFGAVLGDSFGYGFGKKIGPKIFTKNNSFFFDKNHLEKSRIFYEKYGGKTIVLARFMPIVRTFAPILAGVGGMRYYLFLSYNLIGGVLWAAGLTLVGYYLGNTIPDIDRYLLPIIALIIFLSILPSSIHIMKNKENRERLIRVFKR